MQQEINTIRSNTSHYIIRKFRPDDLEPTIELLKYLYETDFEDRLLHFKWKYLQNPFATETMNIVAEKDGQIIGHYGFAALPWVNHSTGTREIIPAPGAIVVHPEHRGYKLMARMHAFGSESLNSSGYSFLINLTATEASMPTFRKMDAFFLQPRQYLYATNFYNFMHYCLNYKKNNYPRVQYKEGTIMCSAAARPKDMARIAASNPVQNKLEIDRSKKFYEWRFQNPSGSYCHYFTGPSDHPTGFLSIVISWNGLRGYIMDWGQTDDASLEHIFRFLKKSNHFDILSIFEMSLDQQIAPVVKKFGLRKNSIVNPFDKRFGGLYPVLLMNIRKDKHNWNWHGLNLKNSDNWLVSNLAREID